MEPQQKDSRGGELPDCQIALQERPGESAIIEQKCEVVLAKEDEDVVLARNILELLEREQLLVIRWR